MATLCSQRCTSTTSSYEYEYEDELAVPKSSASDAGSEMLLGASFERNRPPERPSHRSARVSSYEW